MMWANACPPSVSSPFNCGPDALAATGVGSFVTYVIVAVVVIAIAVGCLVVDWWRSR